MSAEQKKGQVSQASPDDRKKRKADKSSKKVKVANTKTTSGKVTTAKTAASNDKKKIAANTTKTMKKKAQELAEQDAFWNSYAAKNYRGNMNTTVVKTKKGKSIMIQHDVTSPRPYSRLHVL